MSDPLRSDAIVRSGVQVLIAIGSTLVVLTGIGAVCTAALIDEPARAEDWEVVAGLEWHTPTGPEHFDAAVCKLAREIYALAVTSSTATGNAPTNGNQAMRILAMMQALPALSREKNAGTPTFADIRNFCDAQCKRIFDAFSDESKASSEGSVRYRTLDKIALDESLIHPGDVNYHAPMLVVLMEYRASGALDFPGPSNKQGKDADRRPSPTLPIPQSSRLTLARLMALTLSARVNTPSGPVGDFDAPPVSGALWRYTTFGHNVVDSSLSETGTVAMGLKASVNLSLMDLPESVFESKPDGNTIHHLLLRPDQPISRDRFERRLSDVLIHTVITLGKPAELKNADGATTIGVVGVKPYELVRAPTLDVTDFDIGRFQVRSIRTADGRQLIQVEHNSKLQPLGGIERVAAYRYAFDQKEVSRFRPYHTASGGYALLVAAETLAQWLERCERRGVRKVDGKAYTLTRRHADEWEAVRNGETVKLLFRVGRQAPYTRLRVDVDGRTVDLNERIAQTLNSVARALSRPATDKKHRGRVNVAEFRSTIGLGDTHLGLVPADAYGIAKLLISCGYPDYLGDWPWFLRMGEALAAADYAVVPSADAWAAREFAVLFLTRSYRPIFSLTPPGATPP